MCDLLRSMRSGILHAGPIVIAVGLSAVLISQVQAFTYDDLILLVHSETNVFGQQNNSDSLDQRLQQLELKVLGHSGSGSQSQRLRSIGQKIGLIGSKQTVEEKQTSSKQPENSAKAIVKEQQKPVQKHTGINSSKVAQKQKEKLPFQKPVIATLPEIKPATPAKQASIPVQSPQLQKTTASPTGDSAKVSTVSPAKSAKKTVSDIPLPEPAPNTATVSPKLDTPLPAQVRALEHSASNSIQIVPLLFFGLLLLVVFGSLAAFIVYATKVLKESKKKFTFEYREQAGDYISESQASSRIRRYGAKKAEQKQSAPEGIQYPVLASAMSPTSASLMEFTATYRMPAIGTTKTETVPTADYHFDAEIISQSAVPEFYSPEEMSNEQWVIETIESSPLTSLTPEPLVSYTETEDTEVEVPDYENMDMEVYAVPPASMLNSPKSPAPTIDYHLAPVWPQHLSEMRLDAKPAPIGLAAVEPIAMAIKEEIEEELIQPAAAMQPAFMEELIQPVTAMQPAFTEKLIQPVTAMPPAFTEELIQPAAIAQPVATSQSTVMEADEITKIEEFLKSIEPESSTVKKIEPSPATAAIGEANPDFQPIHRRAPLPSNTAPKQSPKVWFRHLSHQPIPEEVQATLRTIFANMPG